MATRIDKKPEKWSDEELVQWALGDVITGRDVSGGQLAKEATKRFGLEDGLTVSEVQEQIVAENLVSDAEPTEAPESDVTPATAEAPAEAPQAAPAAVQEPVAPKAPPAPIPQVAAQAEPVQAQTLAKPQPEAPQEKYDVTRQIFEDQINRYLAAMKPGKAVSAKDGAATQVLLWRTIQMALGRPGSEFIAYFSRLMEVVNEHRQTTFHERYAFRFWEAIPLPVNERNNFERILNLMLTTCNPKTRSHALKQVDLQATLAGFPSTDVQQKVTDFYSI